MTFDLDLQGLRATFLVEALELVGILEAGILALEIAPDLERVHDVFRAAHSLKGGAATIGMTGLVEVTHALETVLDRWRTGQLVVARAHFDALLRTADLLRAAIESGGEVRDPNMAAALGEELTRLATGAAAAPSQRPEVSDTGERLHVTFAPHADAFALGGDPLLVLRELHGLATTLDIILDRSAIPPLADLDPDRCYVRWELVLDPASGVTQARVAEAFEFVDSTADISIRLAEVAEVAVAATAPAAVSTAAASSTVAGGQADSTIRVATEKVDALVDLVGELVISHSAMRELVRDGGPAMAPLQEAVLRTERHLRELQERVMAVRMVPVSALYARIPRMVREVAAKLGKQVKIELDGGETELDKVLVERLVDPVFHLVRNALDHGIEPPELRTAGGKPPAGTLRLSAYARAGNVYLEVSDDGRGLQRDRILEVARSRGLDIAENPSDADVFALIAAPGFSTATVVTELSGRGVGLDVVRRNIEQMGGELTIDSAPGEGTRFRLRLPLTLTIMDGLQVTASGQTWVMPLTDVAFSIQLDPRRVRSLAGIGDVVDLANETLPLISLGDVLHAGSATRKTGMLAVVVQAGSSRYALRVDSLIGQAQVVVKSLETHFRRVPGMIGATILGDGRVALILDGQGLAASAGLRNTGARSAAGSSLS